ncbi:hypothetical protein C8R44DRAFT_869202 [Mycena epipterygia]|nr:hypothetical protein C8R44DRAFT_869202 [Mycena epipterygia]
MSAILHDQWHQSHRCTPRNPPKASDEGHSQTANGVFCGVSEGYDLTIYADEATSARSNRGAVVSSARTAAASSARTASAAASAARTTAAAADRLCLAKPLPPQPALGPPGLFHPSPASRGEHVWGVAGFPFIFERRADALDELFDRGMTQAALMGTSNRRKLVAFVTGEPYVRKPEDSESEPEPDLDEEEGGAESDSDHFWEVSDD